MAPVFLNFGIGCQQVARVTSLRLYFRRKSPQRVGCWFGRAESLDALGHRKIPDSTVKWISNFTLMWPCIVINFFIIKPTRCTNFTNFILAWNSTYFGQFLRPSSGVYSLYTQQWYMSYMFVDSFRAGPAWSSSKAVYKPVWHIPLLNVQWINSWWWTEELSEICRISHQNKICEISASSWFYYKENWLSICRSLIE